MHRSGYRGWALDAKDLFVDEAALTGETYPVEKSAATLAADTPLQKRTNNLFPGTYIVSGQARVVVVAVGRDTEFGCIAHRLPWPAPPCCCPFFHTAETDLADECVDGPSRDDHCDRPGRSRTHRSASPVGHPIHSTIHARVRSRGFHFRLLYIRGVLAGVALDDRPVSHWLVCRVRSLASLIVRHPHSPALLYQSAVCGLADHESPDGMCNATVADDADLNVLGIPTIATVFWLALLGTRLSMSLRQNW